LSDTENPQGIEGVIEIKDPEIDVEQIMQRIRENIQRRRREGGYDEPAFPVFSPEDLGDGSALAAFDSQLLYNLRQANEHYNKIWVEVGMDQAIPQDRIPVLGRLRQALKRRVQNIIIFWVNALARHQIVFNKYVVSVLNRLATRFAEAEQDEEVEALRAEVEALRDRVARLEARLDKARD
jgi:hypothetical protein